MPDFISARAADNIVLSLTILLAVLACRFVAEFRLARACAPIAGPDIDVTVTMTDLGKTGALPNSDRPCPQVARSPQGTDRRLTHRV